ncbi:MAG: hypothetical protein KF773_40080 [Deltaproteobacteria bacterium]|nr:hypothetical protein [Deltaproteobacteria bacterium]
MRHTRVLLAAALAACSSSSSQPPSASNRTPTTSDPVVSVELSGATLADDCGDAVTPARPAPEAQEQERRRAPSKDASATMAAEDEPAPGGCLDPSNCRGPTRAPCVPTSMQLAVRAPSDAVPATLRIKKVELLDPKGAVVDTLEARGPSRWNDDGAYVAWDERIAPGQKVAASYLLSTPDWNQLAGGKWNAHTKVFQLRVTVVVGDAVRTIERRSIVPIAIEPEVET